MKTTILWVTVALGLGAVMFANALKTVCDVLWGEVNLKLHLCPEAKQGAISAFARGSGKLAENLIEMGVIDPETEVQYLLQSPKRTSTEELPMKTIHLTEPDSQEAAEVISKVVRKPKLAARPAEHATAPRSNGRILHGKPVTNITDVPYQVAMITSDGYFCGASLITTRWILTAAHCVSPDATWIVVLMGAECWAEAPVQLYVARAIVHGKYDEYWLTNDIALLDLGGNLNLANLGGRVRPVDLETEGCGDDSLVGELAKVSGWGLTSDSSNAVEECLWYVCTKLISNSECSAYYGIVDRGMVCTVNPNGLNGTLCSGDSGGPLVLKRTGRQVGINSYVSIYGCEAGWPSGYTRVPCYIDWIRAVQSS